MKFKLSTNGTYYSYKTYIKALRKLGFEFEEITPATGADAFMAIFGLKREDKVYEKITKEVEIELNSLEDLLKLRKKIKQDLILANDTKIIIDD